MSSHAAPPSPSAGARAPAARVLHVCTDYWPNVGGIERFVSDLAGRQKAVGWDVHILALNRTAQHRRRLPPHDEHAGVPIRRVGFIDLKYYKPAWMPLRLLRWADILHLHGLGAHSDLCALLRPLHRRPMVLSTHGGVSHTPRLARLKRAYTRGLQPLVLRATRRVVACSAADYELFRPIVSPPRLIRIDNGVDLSALLAEANVERDERRYVFIGRMAPSKRLDRLLRAFAKARDRNLHFTLRLVGPDSGAAEAARVLVGELQLADRIELVGEVDEAALRRELSEAAWFVSASEHEGFGIAVVEAMAAGAVPIVQRNEAFAALVEDGITGRLIDFADPQAAAAALNELSRRGSATFRSAARAAAGAHDWSHVMPRWHALYEQLLPGKPAASTFPPP